MTQKKCEEIAQYMVDNSCTIREAAAYFGVCKSTLHNEITDKLKKYNSDLYKKIRDLLDANWKDRHRRGGIGCSTKYPLLVYSNFNLTLPMSI